jgi:hypothetical protein
MIRCVRAMSSMGYPEVFHRFCGYLCAAKNFQEIFRATHRYALSSGRRMNFGSLAKKFWSALRRCRDRHFSPTPQCAVARTVQPRNFAEKIPSRASIS